MIQPPYLKTGDTIGIVAPASSVTKDEIKPAIDLITAWGVKINLGKNLFQRKNSFAGTDAQRMADFQEMLDRTDVNAILCARGGYGTIRIIDKLNFNQFRKHPKWIIGCSDITVIHAFLQGYLGIESMHAVMPRHITSGRRDLTSLQTLKEALFGNLKNYDVRPHPLNRIGKSSGVLVGGNLSVLFSLRGTPYDMDTGDKILFIEDVNEYLYHIDRIIMNFTLDRKLEGLKGLVVGGMSGMKTSASGFCKSAFDIIREATASFQYPVLFGAPSGHVKPNKALILGRQVTMQIDDACCRLIF